MRFAFTLHRLLARASLSAGMLFAWVMLFVWELEHTQSLTTALSETAFAYALSQIVLILLAPWAGRLYARGAIRVMVSAMILLAGALVGLGVALQGGFVPVWGLIAFALLAGAYRALYATPFALVQHDMHEERYWFDVALAYIPLLVGLVLTQHMMNESAVLFVAAACALLAIVPLVRFEAYEKYEWSYRETFGMLLEPVHRSFVGHSFIRGIEGAALFFAWPLFVFIILGQSYLALGLVYSVTAFLLIALRLAAPEKPIISTPLMAATVTGASWLARIVAVGPLAIIGLQVVGAGVGKRRMHEHIVSDHFADGGTFLDEITTLKEVSLAGGRLVFALFFALVLHLCTPAWALGLTFVLAAVAGAIASYKAATR